MKKFCIPENGLKTPKALSAALHRVAPFFRQSGINIDFRRSHGKNLISLSVAQEGSGTTYTHMHHIHPK